MATHTAKHGSFEAFLSAKSRTDSGGRLPDVGNEGSHSKEATGSGPPGASPRLPRSFTNEKLCKKPFLVAGLDKEIEKLSSRVWHARVYAMHLVQLLSTRVYVPQDHGNASMWTLQDPSWGSHS